MNFQKFALTVGATLSGLSVLLGAAAAHMLKKHLNESNFSRFETANYYLLLGGVYLILLNLSWEKLNPLLRKWAFFSGISGVLLFTGSLYVLSLANIPFASTFTPFGGVLMILSWFFMALGAWLTNKK